MDFRNNITIEKARETFDKKNHRIIETIEQWVSSKNNEWDLWEQHNNVWDVKEE